MKTDGIETCGITGANQAGEGFIDKGELARRLNKSVRTVDNWMRQGLLPYYKIGGKSVSFRWSEVVEHLRERCQIRRGPKGGL
ncbi:MAG: helix-turn-helix transcriptional regulator [Limisphaerales bacterium]